MGKIGIVGVSLQAMAYSPLDYLPGFLWWANHLFCGLCVEGDSQMSLLDQLLEPWEEYIVRRKIERTSAITITRWPDGTIWLDEIATLKSEVRHDR